MKMKYLYVPLVVITWANYTLTAQDNTAAIQAMEANLKMVKVANGSFKKVIPGTAYTQKIKINTFSIQAYEVSQSQWETVMGTSPFYFKCPDCPAEQIGYEDALRFIQRLNEATGKQYRLPSDNEWEFAAMGGNNSQHYRYAGGNNLADVGWFEDNSGGRTHTVGLLQPNELGVYDMSGNVWEWCGGWYAQTTYKEDTAVVNAFNASMPGLGNLHKIQNKVDKVPEVGYHNILRGGSWSNFEGSLTIANRFRMMPDFKSNNTGFRLAHD